MKLTRSISVSALCLYVCIAQLAASRPVSAGDENTAQAILDAMLQAGKKVKNVNCRSEHVYWRSHGLQEAGYQEARTHGIPEEEAVKRLREFALDRYQFAYDDQGRFRVEHTQGRCDPNLDPAIFRIDFPKGTQVTDMRTGQSRVAGENP